MLQRFYSSGMSAVMRSASGLLFLLVPVGADAALIQKFSQTSHDEKAHHSNAGKSSGQNQSLHTDPSPSPRQTRLCSLLLL